MLTVELLELIKTRRSIRNFSNEQISDEEIYYLIDAARYAPSNSNRQPWKFLVLENKTIQNQIVLKVEEKIEQIKCTLKNKELEDVVFSYEEYFTFFKNAPVLIFALFKDSPLVLQQFISKEDSFGKISPELISTSMAVQNLLLAAHTAGLGACCTTGPLIAADEIKKILDVRPPFEIAVMIALGKVKENTGIPERKKFSKIVEIIK